MKKKLVMIDAIRVITEELDQAFSSIIPDAEILHIVDEGLLQYKDTESKQLGRRLCNLALGSEEIGANVILITCAHGIPFVNLVQMFVGTPVEHITLPMIEEAVKRAQRIGLVATEEAIIKPIVGLLEEAAERVDKRVKVEVGLCEEAFQARLSGDIAKFDELLLKTIRDVSKGVEAIVLAQVSSARVVPKAKEQTHIPILSSPIIAAEKIKAMLG